MSSVDRREAVRWPGALLVGVLLGLIVAIVALAVVGIGVALAVAAVTILVAAAAFAAHRANTTDPRADIEPTGSVPKVPPHTDRPLGDTREAHDEITPHDIPRGSPERLSAERQAESESGDPDETFRATEGAERTHPQTEGRP